MKLNRWTKSSWKNRDICGEKNMRRRRVENYDEKMQTNFIIYNGSLAFLQILFSGRWEN